MTLVTVTVTDRHQEKLKPEHITGFRYVEILRGVLLPLWSVVVTMITIITPTHTQYVSVFQYCGKVVSNHTPLSHPPPPPNIHDPRVAQARAALFTATSHWIQRERERERERDA